MRLLRWLLVVPGLPVAWVLGWGFFGGLEVALSKTYTALYGVSQPTWLQSYSALYQFAGHLGFATAAFFHVLLPTLAAPSHREIVAVISFAIGFVISLLVVASGYAVDVALTAIGAGVATLWLVLAHLRRASRSDQRML